MSEPSKKSPKRRKVKGAKWRKVTELPDDQAMRKLFPNKLMDRVDREIGREPKPKR